MGSLEIHSHSCVRQYLPLDGSIILLVVVAEWRVIKTLARSIYSPLMSTTTQPEFLIYGANGYLGSHIVTVLRAQSKTFEIGKARIENKASVEAEIDSLRPKYVICAAGLAGKPNVVRHVHGHFKRFFKFLGWWGCVLATTLDNIIHAHNIIHHLIIMTRRIGLKIRRTSPKLFALMYLPNSTLLMLATHATCTAHCWVLVWCIIMTLSIHWKAASPSK